MSVDVCSMIFFCVAKIRCLSFLRLDSVSPVLMDDIVRLGGSSQLPSTHESLDLDSEYAPDIVHAHATSFVLHAPPTGISNGGGVSRSTRSSCSPSGASLPHKVRGPNWTEAEMHVLITHKRIEWDGRHNCSQPSLAKFVYGTTAWKLVLAGYMSVVGFRAKDTNQITNKWDGLIKDYKKLKIYIDGTGSTNLWGLSKEEKKQLSRTMKMSLEFNESMYIEIEGFVGRRQIFGRANDVVVFLHRCHAVLVAHLLLHMLALPQWWRVP